MVKQEQMLELRRKSLMGRREKLDCL